MSTYRHIRTTVILQPEEIAFVERYAADTFSGKISLADAIAVIAATAISQRMRDYQQTTEGTGDEVCTLQ